MKKLIIITLLVLGFNPISSYAESPVWDITISYDGGTLCWLPGEACQLEIHLNFPERVFVSGDEVDVVLRSEQINPSKVNFIENIFDLPSNQNTKCKGIIILDQTSTFDQSLNGWVLRVRFI